MRVLPGDIAMVILAQDVGTPDPAQLEALRSQLGLNQPLYQQYFSWLGHMLVLDMGKSYWTGEPVWQEIATRLPYTVSLIVLSISICLLVAIPAGIVCALKQDTWLDYSLRSFAIAGLSIPHFWFSILLLLFLVTFFRWFPPLDYAPVFKDPLAAIQQLILPAVVLSASATSTTTRMMRSSMLEVLREDYVRTALSKGLRDRTVFYVHALKNAILPVITVVGLQAVFVFSSAVIVESIFNVPGVGRMLVGSIVKRDVILVQGTVTLMAALVVGINLLVDLIYAWLDPRIRLR